MTRKHITQLSTLLITQEIKQIYLKKSVGFILLTINGGLKTLEHMLMLPGNRRIMQKTEMHFLCMSMTYSKFPDHANLHVL